MALSDLAIRNAKPAEKPYKLSDSGGLYLLVQTNGSRLWKLKYRFDGKERSLAFGPYPLVALAEAREKRDAAKKLLLAGTDPSAQKRKDRAEALFASLVVRSHGRAIVSITGHFLLCAHQCGAHPSSRRLRLRARPPCPLA